MAEYSDSGSDDSVPPDKGANPRELPVEQPMKFELLVNVRAARALGITIPQSLLMRTDEFIQ